MNLFNADFPFRSRDSALSIVPILVGTNPANTVIQWLTGLESKIKARGVGSESSRSLSPGARRSCDFTLVAAVGTTGLSLWSDGRPAVCLLRGTFKCPRNSFLTMLDAFGLTVYDQLPWSKKKKQDVSAVLRVEAALLPPLKRVPTCGPCTFNVTTQEHGSVFALCESCFDVSVMLDGAARGRIQWDHPRSNGTTTVGLAKGHPMVSRLRLGPLPGRQVPRMAVTRRQCLRVRVESRCLLLQAKITTVF